jgi:uncharacterized protein
VAPVIIVFAKAPIAGHVKTRLFGLLSPDEAANLHRAFVEDLFESLLPAFTPAALELHSDTPTDDWTHIPVARKTQNTGDLGARMFHALCEALDAGHSQVVIVGSDCPDLPASHVVELMRSEADVSIGPTEDGGYWGIACRRVHPAMFEGVRWSTPSALEDTLHTARRYGLSVEVGPVWHDVDTPADLDRLRRATDLPRHTAKRLRLLGRIQSS